MCKMKSVLPRTIEREREREREGGGESTHQTVEVGTLVGVFTYKVGTKLRSGDMPGSLLQRWHLNALKHILVGLGGVSPH